jgi:hypothetical protein
MSFSAIISKYPAADGYLRDAMALLSTTPTTHSNTKCEVVKTTELSDNAVFVLPLVDATLPALPSMDELLGDSNQLFLFLKGKHKRTVSAHDLVCDIVGGEGHAEDTLAAGQTGITFSGVEHVLVPSEWMLRDALAAGFYKVAAAPGALAGNAASVDNPTLARGLDLDDNRWTCSDKRGAQLKLEKIMAVTRLWSKKRSERYITELLQIHHELLAGACTDMLATGGVEAAPGDANEGLHLYPALRPLGVMLEGFAEDSKFQNALLLRFDALDHSKISIQDFQEPLETSSMAQFERDRSSTPARSMLRNCLEFVETFFVTFSGPCFEGALRPLIKSLGRDTALWNKFQDPFLLFRMTLMMQQWGTAIRTQKDSPINPTTIKLCNPEGAAALLLAMAKANVVDAKELLHGYTDGTHGTFFAHGHGLYWAIKAHTACLPATPKRKFDDLPHAGGNPSHSASRNNQH